MPSTPISVAASGGLSWCDRLPMKQADSTASCDLELVSKPADPIFPPLSTAGAFIHGLVGGS